jgi:5-methyltetrahydrofolate--homocysteine methyltransferase
VGEAARSLWRDAQAMLDRIVRGRLLTARAVVGFWPANAVGDDVRLYADVARREALGTVHFLRQQQAKGDGRPNYCLADFVAPRTSGLPDWLGGFAVTTGIGLDALVAAHEAAHDPYSAILAKALADRLAEAFAERMHEQVRREYWGYAPDEALDNLSLIREQYRGIRPAPGYPACPDHTEKGPLFRLLGATESIGLQLTESFAMYPTAAVSGYYIGHPESRYFGIGKIGRDQVEDYAARREIPVDEAARWLAPNIA